MSAKIFDDYVPARTGKLSERQIEIMDLVVKGFSNKTIADRLQLSPHTVSGHFKQIYLKLGVHTRFEVVLKYNILVQSLTAEKIDVLVKASGVPKSLQTPPINVGDDTMPNSANMADAGIDSINKYTV